MDESDINELQRVCADRGISLDSPLAAQLYRDIKASKPRKRRAGADWPDWVKAAREALAVSAWPDGVTTVEVCKARGKPVTKANTMACGAALRDAGWTRRRMMRNLVRQWLFVPPG